MNVISRGTLHAATATNVFAVHVIELRSALDSARAQLALRTITYTTPAIVPGSTPIMKAHVDDLRNGVK